MKFPWFTYFKILCRTYNQAKRIFIAVKQWLKERLKLEVSEEKSKITNLRKNYTNFLGVKIKVRPKNKSYVVVSHISDKAYNKCVSKLKKHIEEIRHNKNQVKINQLNSVILGMHNYYRCATHCNLDFRKIAFQINTKYYTTLKKVWTPRGNPSSTYLKLYGEYNYKMRYICGIPIFPIAGIKMKILKGFSQDICNYTLEGRKKIHLLLQNVNTNILKYLMKNPIENRSIEYNDNRLSLYCGQNGICQITGQQLNIGDMECHHKKPYSLSKDDSYNNLVWLKKDIHRLIHLVDQDKIKNITEKYNLDIMQKKENQ